MKAELLGCQVLHADETPVAMLAPGKGKTQRAYLWAYASARSETLKAVVYDFSGYKALFALRVPEVGCMAHARQVRRTARRQQEQHRSHGAGPVRPALPGRA